MQVGLFLQAAKQAARLSTVGSAMRAGELGGTALIGFAWIAVSAEFLNRAVISGAIATVLAAYEELGLYDLTVPNRLKEIAIIIQVGASTCANCG
jgi:hypothetical protein